MTWSGIPEVGVSPVALLLIDVINPSFAGDICVLFTANDAHMRGFDVIVPADCVASERESDNAHALRYMARILKADIATSNVLNFLRCAGVPR